MDQQPAARRDLLDAIDQLLPLFRGGRALDASTVEPLFLKTCDHFVAILRLELPHLRPLQHRAVRIRERRETSGTLQHGAEASVLLNAVAARMHDLAIQSDGAANVVPAADLADGQDVTGLKSNVGV